MNTGRIDLHGVSIQQGEGVEWGPDLDNLTRRYFDSLIVNCGTNPHLRMAKFTEDATLVTHEDKASMHYAQSIGAKMPGSYFVVATFKDIDLFGPDWGTPVGAMFTAYMELVPEVRFQKHADQAHGMLDLTTVFPSRRENLKRWAIMFPTTGDDENADFHLIFRNTPQDKQEAPEIAKAWMDDFLQAYEVPTPRALTKLVLEQTEKWIRNQGDNLDEETATALRDCVLAGAQCKELNVEEIAALRLNNDAQREEYIGRLLDKGLPSTTFKPDRDWAERQAAKKTYLCDDGIQITGPSDVIDNVVQVMPKTADRKTRLVVETRRFLQK